MHFNTGKISSLFGRLTGGRSARVRITPRYNRHPHPTRRRAWNEAAVFLKVGDVVELGIDGLGRQRQIVTAFRI